MTKIAFEDKAVAFIYVLGFSAIVKSANRNPTAAHQVQILIDLLSSAVPRLDKKDDQTTPARLIPVHTYISDAIILSAPLSDRSVASYNGLEVLVMRCIQLTQHFLQSGYLLRGGIAVGKAWHEKSNIVGPAYQEAYLLEVNGNVPRIVLSDRSVAYWKKGLGGSSRMCIRKDGIAMVNGLHDFYLPGDAKYGLIGNTYDNYARLAESAINSSMPQKAKEKWLWFKEYLDAERSVGRMWSVA